MTSSMPASAAMASAVRPLSPVSMTTRRPEPRSVSTAVAGALLERVGQGQEPGGPAVDGDEDDGLPFPGQPAGRLGAAPRHRRLRSRRACGCPTRTRFPPTTPSTPMPSRARKPSAASTGDALGPGPADDGLAERVLGARSRPRPPAKAASSRPMPDGRAGRRSTSGSPVGQRPRLVEDERVDLVDGLQALAAPDQDAALGAPPRPDHDGRRASPGPGRRDRR